MKVLGTPDHQAQDGQGRKDSEPEQNEHTLIGLPGRELADQAHASETLSILKANF